MPVNENYADAWGALWVLVGSSRALDRAAYLDATLAAPQPDLTQHLWDGDRLASFLADGRSSS